MFMSKEILISNIDQYMTRKKKLFTVQSNNKNIDMNVDEALHKPFLSLTPIR